MIHSIYNHIYVLLIVIFITIYHYHILLYISLLLFMYILIIVMMYTYWIIVPYHSSHLWQNSSGPGSAARCPARWPRWPRWPWENSETSAIFGNKKPEAPSILGNKFVTEAFCNKLRIEGWWKIHWKKEHQESSRLSLRCFLQFCHWNYYFK